MADYLRSYYERRIPEAVLAAGRYEVRECGACGFLWQAEVLDGAGMAALYGEWISPRASREAREGSDLAVFAGYARQLELVPRLCGKHPQETDVLDFGMGWGRWCLMAKAYGFRAKGVETSRDRLDHAARQGLDVFSDLAAAGHAAFDFINAEQVFEHLPDPLATLRPLVATLRPGGVLRISVPNAAREARELRRRGWKPFKGALQPLEHINGFTNPTLRRFGREVGLTPLPQPFLPGQGLLGKSYRRGAIPWLKSVAGVPYRAFFGTTMWFRKAGPSR
jgi:2-polyprenyl-3-methyl-5-hydroxy-6-metoxy-1,4-benzoquinol methylase